MIIIQFFLVLLLGFSYWIYTGEIILLFSLIAFTLLGTAIFYIISRAHKSFSYSVYLWGIIIYGFYMLITHIACIKDPSNSCFVHVDAYGGFFTNTVLRFKDSAWNDLSDILFVSAYCNEYPGSGVWFVGLAKIADSIGVQNLRFFLRMQSVMFGACILGLIADLFSLYHIKKVQILKFVLGFALFSYLVFSAVIFTRDIHVAFFYTCIGYIYLKPHCKNRVAKLVILALLAALPRPENGLFALIFPVLYMYSSFKNTNAIIPIMIILIIVGSFLLYDAFLNQMDQIDYYHNRTKEVENANGLFLKFRSLPFPFDIIFVVIYTVIHPLPFDSYVYQGAENGGGWVAAPSMITPFYWSYFFLLSLVLFLKRKKMKIEVWYLLAASLFFVVLTEFIDPNVRRTFAIYPTIFMVCILFRGLVDLESKKAIKNIWWPILLLINIFSIMYLRF